MFFLIISVLGYGLLVYNLGKKGLYIYLPGYALSHNRFQFKGPPPYEVLVALSLVLDRLPLILN